MTKKENLMSHIDAVCGLFDYIDLIQTQINVAKDQLMRNNNIKTALLHLDQADALCTLAVMPITNIKKAIR